MRLQRFWGEWEQELASRSELLAEEVGTLRQRGDSEAVRRLTSRFMQDNLEEALRRLEAWEAGGGRSK
jgi:hypothetical protein